ncbi:hypothetical protein HRbin24_02150 [bacterium HR24]|nr:hypothetical protein HRbin24_02150 [bacterium HR24]
MMRHDHSVLERAQRHWEAGLSIDRRLELLAEMLAVCRAVGVLPCRDPWHGIDEKLRLARAFKEPWLAAGQACSGPR